MWLNLGLCWRITKIGTTSVSVSYPKQVKHSLKREFSFCCVGYQVNTRVEGHWVISKDKPLNNYVSIKNSRVESSQCIEDKSINHVYEPRILVRCVSKNKQIIRSDLVLSKAAIGLPKTVCFSLSIIVNLVLDGSGAIHVNSYRNFHQIKLFLYQK